MATTTKESTSRRLVLVASLYINPGMEAEFERFESAAGAVMARHGGAIERRIRSAQPAGADSPYEVHIVTFPDVAAFDRYRADPAIAAMAQLRTDAIARTSIVFGADLAPWPVA
jgi:uncharacterized protein (DUF1330 family)